MRNIYYVVFLVFLSIRAIGQDLASKQITGTIFLDRNEDGIYNKQERGLKDILVSNGVDIVKTDNKGHFTIVVRVGQSIFPILPNNLEHIGSRSTKIINALYTTVPTADSLQRVSKIDFPVRKQSVQYNFSFGAIGDVQVDNEQELDYAAQSIFSELANTHDHAFNIFLGDLVNDEMDIMAGVRDNIDLTSTPSFTLVGNHDRNTANQLNLTDQFNEFMGASTYAFNHGKAHFIVLNNVFSTGEKSYEGRIDDDQLIFIKNDLQYLKKSAPIVICQHIPMFATKNRDKIFELLEGYTNVLILSGHTHVVSRSFYANGNIHELGAGATCGTWWRGEKDMYGIPLALMQCGAPRGYFKVSFKGDDYSFKFKGVGQDEKRQMHAVLDSTSLIANIYGSSDSSVVDVQIDGGNWVTMRKVDDIDPLVADIIEKNKLKTYPTIGSTVLPLRARKSTHIWRLDGLHFQKERPVKLRFKATDKYGFALEQDFVFNR
ncbi:3',5'-cyclic AMP phosphodiesterase CpdA [Sphingobacterium nematocida]|uniref:3',5'-cyclic AMP phosphodiesterase CpdA n=1 Tax=Sphingobacterium nematocida TaxID=1513896 RepID=A0A1T5B1H5_9SPHI|nr:calcineurin-like phosphoesterase family protein [Sphingobacterium nematocida]SKB40917.1 3',5'-cyclic AMP phosphodiesterase CpdA [Sphingobacterium nematocida]